MEETEKSKASTLYTWLTVVLCPIIVAISSILYGFTTDRIAGNTIAFTVMLTGIVFAYERQRISKRLLFDNEKHPWRFYAVYTAGVLICAVFPLISEYGRPYLVLFVALTMVSDEISSLSAGATLLVVCELLSKEPSFGFLIAFLVPAIICVMMFSTVNEDFRILIPMAVSVFSQFVCLCMTSILFSNRTFGFDLFFIPFVNVLICVILILILLKVISFTFVFKKDDRYMDILDPEFELLSDLKNYSKEDYDHSIYTAVLCSKLAIKLGLDEKLTKALGFYHRIGSLRGENNWENTYGLMQEHMLPEEVIDLMREYYSSKDEGVFSRNTAVLVIAETVISSISYLFSKDKDARINYDKLINTIIDKKIESGIFSNSKLTFEDINIIRKTLGEEKLFYDFLR